MYTPTTIVYVPEFFETLKYVLFHPKKRTFPLGSGSFFPLTTELGWPVPPFNQNTPQSISNSLPIFCVPKVGTAKVERWYGQEKKFQPI